MGYRDFEVGLSNYITKIHNEFWDNYNAYVSLHIKDEHVLYDLYKLLEFNEYDIDNKYINQLYISIAWDNEYSTLYKLHMTYKEYIIEFRGIKSTDEDRKYLYINYIIDTIYKIDEEIINKCNILNIDLADIKFIKNVVDNNKLKVIFKNNKIPTVFNE